MNKYRFGRFVFALILLFCVSACAVGTVVGTATDVAIEVVKVPFKVGGAIVDAVDGDESDKNKEE